jgi:hypothetical protein
VRQTHDQARHIRRHPRTQRNQAAGSSNTHPSREFPCSSVIPYRSTSHAHKQGHAEKWYTRHFTSAVSDARGASTLQAAATHFHTGETLSVQQCDIRRAIHAIRMQPTISSNTQFHFSDATPSSQASRQHPTRRLAIGVVKTHSPFRLQAAATHVSVHTKFQPT